MESSVARFYDGAHVLITGATGFMGKVLTEKLLRSCTGIQQIYLLIRVKKGKDPTARLKDLFDDPIFGVMKAALPDYKSKITLVTGDCSVEGLGMSAEDRKMLESVLTHIFHGAATVNFNEKLKLAVGINVLGVREVMTFCQSCKNIKSIIHTSTAYVHNPRKVIEEKFYPTTMTVKGAIQLVQCLEDDKIERLTEEIIKPWPNTYTFTKAIGEEAVRLYGAGLPVGIFRPSIVMSTAEEPIKGWTDNMNGPIGVVYGVGMGALRVMPADGDTEANTVPVDKAVNAIICAAWDVANHCSESQTIVEQQCHASAVRPTKTDIFETDGCKIPIYQFVVPKENQITWREFLDNCFSVGKEMPSNNGIWYYTLTLCHSWSMFKLLAFFYHTLPALLIDFGLFLSGNKPLMMKAFEKINKLLGVLVYFTMREWDFKNGQVVQLWGRMSPEDRELFEFDMSKLDWKKYHYDIIVGMRLYLFKESPSTIPQARRRMFFFKVAHYALLCTVYSILLYSFYIIVSALLSANPDFTMNFTTSRWSSRRVSIT